MQATANARCRNTTAQSLAPHTMPKRRSFNGSARSTAESATRKSAPPISGTDNNSLTEAEIIVRAQNGDHAMFEQLYRLHSRRVYAVCLRMLGDPSEAEDLTQEAFMLLFRKIHTFRGESAFSTWLHRLVVNLVLMHLRKKSLPTVSMEAAPGPNGETAASNVDIAASDLFLEGSIDRINLSRCIAQLPVGSRAIFVLHDIQGYKHYEIAQMLGRSEGVSKSQLHRARKRLRELLHEIEREKYRDERVAAQKML